MTDASLPLVECPECGAVDAVEIVGACNPMRQFGPGERAHYYCAFCKDAWIAIVPEPPDAYAGDGIFAANH